jgi:hypothetical protein
LEFSPSAAGICSLALDIRRPAVDIYPSAEDIGRLAVAIWFLKEEIAGWAPGFTPPTMKISNL